MNDADPKRPLRWLIAGLGAAAYAPKSASADWHERTMIVGVMAVQARYRRVSADHSGTLQLLWEQANAQRLGNPIPVAADPSATERLRSRLAKPGTVAVLAEDDHGPLASAFAAPLEDGRAQIDGAAHVSAIAVVPARWGQGLGAGILQFLEQALSEDGYRFAQLHVLETNRRARALYERWGWRLTRTGDPHPEGPQAVYEKYLSSSTARERSAASVAVRRANREDVEAWLDLLTIVAAEGRWIGTEAPIDRDARRSRFLEGLDRDEGAGFVAVSEGRLVGSLGVAFSGSGVVDLGMFVAPDSRRRGVGGALMQACLDWAQSAGAHKVSLTVFPHNHAALALYAKFGFRAEGTLRRQFRRRNGESWDGVVMSLVLGAGGRFPSDESAPIEPHAKSDSDSGSA